MSVVNICHILYMVNYAIIFLLYCLGYMDVRKETISPLKIGNMLVEDFSGVRFEEQKKVASWILEIGVSHTLSREVALITENVQ